MGLLMCNSRSSLALAIGYPVAGSSDRAVAELWQSWSAVLWSVSGMAMNDDYQRRFLCESDIIVGRSIRVPWLSGHNGEYVGHYAFEPAADSVVVMAGGCDGGERCDCHSDWNDGNPNVVPLVLWVATMLPEFEQDFSQFDPTQLGFEEDNEVSDNSGDELGAVPMDGGNDVDDEVNDIGGDDDEANDNGGDELGAVPMDTGNEEDDEIKDNGDDDEGARHAIRILKRPSAAPTPAPTTTGQMKRRQIWRDVV